MREWLPILHASSSVENSKVLATISVQSTSVVVSEELEPEFYHLLRFPGLFRRRRPSIRLRPFRFCSRALSTIRTNEPRQQLTRIAPLRMDAALFRRGTLTDKSRPGQSLALFRHGQQGPVRGPVQVKIPLEGVNIKG